MVQNDATHTNDEREPLDLTPPPADIVTVNGERYELARASELSLRERARWNFLLKRCKRLEAKLEPSEADSREYDDHVRETARIALPTAPPELFDHLSRGQLGDLAMVFFTRAVETSPRVEELRRVASRIGPRSSPGSPASTAPTPSDGST